MLHIERRHSIELPAPVEAVFALFTPQGERLWAADWQPEFLHPESGETCENMVFRTRHNDEETLWSCILWQPLSHRVSYARVTPGSRFGRVDVACRQSAPHTTQAVVSYTFTALSPGGARWLDGLSEAAYTEMIEEWRVQIEAHLSAKPG